MTNEEMNQIENEISNRQGFLKQLQLLAKRIVEASE